MGSLTPLFDLLRQALALLLVLPILIAVHELGHFWVARLLGMKVDAFAVMIGGVRKTKLDKYLPKPIVPAAWLLAFGGASFFLLIAAALRESVPFTLFGLFLVGIALPIWVVTRLGALYHMTAVSSLGILFKTWAVGVLLSYIGTKFQGVSPVQLLGIVALASLVGAAIVYYQPVLRKPEDALPGHGVIDVEEAIALREKSDEVTDESAQDYATGMRNVPVSFRPLLSRTDRHGTEFALLCWPLGGFAAIKGMHPREDGGEVNVPGGFYSKPALSRLAVLFAGPFFSMAFGVLLLTALYTSTGELTRSKQPVLGEVVASGPAAKAGLKEGDRIVAVNGKPVKQFFDVTSVVRTSLKKKGDSYVAVPVQLLVVRGGSQLSVTVVPEVDKTPTPVADQDWRPTKDKAIQARLMVRPGTERQRMAFTTALSKAAMQPIDLVTGLIGSVAKPAELADNVGGPVAIAQVVGQAANDGIDQLLNVAALLSISLGVMNLLPIGPLDGGQMVVAFTELLRGGKRLSYNFQMKLTTVGALLVVALVLCVVTLDIGHTTIGR